MSPEESVGAKETLESQTFWIPQAGSHKAWLKALCTALLDSGGVRSEALLLSRPLCQVCPEAWTPPVQTPPEAFCDLSSSPLCASRCGWTAVSGCCPSSSTLSCWTMLTGRGGSPSPLTSRTSSAFAPEVLRPPVAPPHPSTLTLVRLTATCILHILRYSFIR